MNDKVETEIDISELIVRDPREMTDEDFRALVAGLRQKMHRFIQGDRKAGSTKPKTAAAKKAEKITSIKMDIDL